MTLCVCPHCGGSLSDFPPISVNPDRRQAVIVGKVYHLTRQVARLLEAFVAAKGRVLTMDQIIGHVWDIESEPEWPDETIKVHICRLRRILKKSGYKIVTEWGVGYRLAPESEEQSRPPGRFGQDFYGPGYLDAAAD